MKRAEVAKLPPHEQVYKDPNVWYFDTFDQPVDPDAMGCRIADRPYYTSRDPVGGDRYPTHESALAAALASVGLTPTSPEPMEAP